MNEGTAVNGGTTKIDLETIQSQKTGEIIREVYRSLTEKGYNPIDQMVGYILSGDPTYITSYNNARTAIRKLERDELVEELLKSYLKNE